MDRKWISCAIVAGMLATAALSGCNVPPDPIRTPTGSIKEMHVGPAETDLHNAVKDAEAARVNYRYRVHILQGYYNGIGNHDKHAAATYEMKNIDTAQYFRWVGFAEGSAGEPVNVLNADEASLVEAVVGAREQWTAALEKVAALYESRNMQQQAAIVRRVTERLDPVDLPVYLLSAELPPATLRPTDVVPEADAIFEEARSLFRQGKGLIPALTTSYNKQRRALLLFKKLVKEHQTSNKIALSAYYIAEIYKEYFDKDVLALAWYQRAWEWDPGVPEPARFQAATVCERLRDFPKAVECYRASLQHDPERPLNASFARKRIKDLTGREYTEK